MKLIRAGSDLFLAVLAACLIVGFVSYWQQFFGPLKETVEIDLSPWALPRYTFFSLSRGLLAFGLSLLFSLIWGFWAAKDRVAEKVLIPLLDVLQSIPFLGFLPGVVLLMIGLFPRSDVGLELAAIILMFTSQVWNMAFSVYHSVRTVPQEKVECAAAYGFSAWEKIKWIELPFSVLSLTWNGIMSMAGGWFFLMVNEAFRLGNRDFRMPGLGSYMSVAASQGDVFAMISAAIAMLILIIFLDQLLWRPLIVWSQKSRVEETGSAIQAESWFLHVIRNSYFLAALRILFLRSMKVLQNIKAGRSKPVRHRFLALSVSRVCLAILIGLLFAAAFFTFRLLIGIAWEKWGYLGEMALLTLGRVTLCVAISTCIALPLGLAIGLSEKWSRLLEPIIQIGASFPASLLFPAAVFLFKLMHIPLSIGSIVLMLMGTQWYVLFNVIAGAKAVPSDFREAATSFRFSRLQRFRWLYLPAVFPYLITGILTASGGAWNASIVSEYVTYKTQVLTTPGLGSTISIAAQNNDYPLLAASILLMVVVVALLNIQVWLRLYHYSEKRFALNV